MRSILISLYLPFNQLQILRAGNVQLCVILFWRIFTNIFKYSYGCWITIYLFVVLHVCFCVTIAC